MNMTKIHVISDLYLRFNEHSHQEELLPDVDLVIINGNIGHIKRSMLYAETLCKKYPDIQFIYNLGETELYHTMPKFYGEIQESLSIRRSTNSTWPKNLHWCDKPQIIQCRNHAKFDVLCTYGYPKIHRVKTSWEDTRWSKFYVTDIIDDDDPSGKWYKPIETSNVRHGCIPVFANMDWVNAQHVIEHQQVKKWELEPTEHKLLVTHINPYMDDRTANQVTSPYLIHLNEGVWIGSNTQVNNINFLGSRFFSNPGRGPARQQIFSV